MYFTLLICNIYRCGLSNEFADVLYNYLQIHTHNVNEFEQEINDLHTFITFTLRGIKTVFSS